MTSKFWALNDFLKSRDGELPSAEKSYLVVEKSRNTSVQSEGVAITPAEVLKGEKLWNEEKEIKESFCDETF